ncbi:hypothetical protein D3C83_93350 [compost metagenome]
MVAATRGGAAATNSAASRVVMCSITTLRPGWRNTSGERMRSMNTRSRSKTSTSGSVTSPCTSSGMPCCSIASSTRAQRAMSVTPESELVVAPAG